MEQPSEEHDYSIDKERSESPGPEDREEREPDAIDYPVQ